MIWRKEESLEDNSKAVTKLEKSKLNEVRNAQQVSVYKEAIIFH